MISIYLNILLSELANRLPNLQIIRKYPTSPLPYPLKKTVITVGVNGAKAKHSAISKTKGIEIAYDFSFDICSNNAQGCLEAFDSLMTPLMFLTTTPPFEEIVLGEVSFDSNTHSFILPISAKMTALIKEVET